MYTLYTVQHSLVPRLSAEEEVSLGTRLCIVLFGREEDKGVEVEVEMERRGLNRDVRVETYETLGGGHTIQMPLPISLLHPSPPNTYLSLVCQRRERASETRGTRELPSPHAGRGSELRHQ